MSCTRGELVIGVPVSFQKRAHENLPCSSAISPSTPRGHLWESAEGLNQFQAESHFAEKKIHGVLGRRPSLQDHVLFVFLPKNRFHKSRRKEEVDREGVLFPVQCLQSETWYS